MFMVEINYLRCANKDASGYAAIYIYINNKLIAVHRKNDDMNAITMASARLFFNHLLVGDFCIFYGYEDEL